MITTIMSSDPPRFGENRSSAPSLSLRLRMFTVVVVGRCACPVFTREKGACEGKLFKAPNVVIGRRGRPPFGPLDLTNK